MEALRSRDIRTVVDGSFAFRGLAPAERTALAAGEVEAISFMADVVRDIATANPAFKEILLKLVESRALHAISIIPSER